jgi:phage-related tail protein
MLYQSMSGDAETGTSSFTMTGGSLVSKNGDMFYVTNTDCVISLSGVALTLADGTNLLTVSGNDGAKGWGTVGANGGICAFNLSKQTLSGNIAVDTISKPVQLIPTKPRQLLFP